MGKEIKCEVLVNSKLLYPMFAVLSIFYSVLTFLLFLADVLPAVIRANVLSGERPSLTDDENIEGYIQLIVRCWDKQPECRLDFKGELL